MPQTILNAETGRTTGSAASRRLRSTERIPAVVYGRGMEPLVISIVRSELRVAVSGASGMNTVIDLTVDGKVYPSLIKDVQRHPVRRTVQHVDFLQVDLNEEVSVDVPIRLDGEAREVLANNGLVDQALEALHVSTTPRNIPDEIVVDISEMTMDSVIRVGDIVLPAGVSTVVDPEAPVATVIATRDETAGEGEEGDDADASADE